MKASTCQPFQNIKAVLAAARAQTKRLVTINTSIPDANKFMNMPEAAWQYI